jgi:hypothetical protein
MAAGTPDDRRSIRVRLGAGFAAFATVAVGVLLFNHVLAATTGAGLFPSIALVAAVAAVSFPGRRAAPSGVRRALATGALLAAAALVAGALLLVVLFVAVCAVGDCSIE